MQMFEPVHGLSISPEWSLPLMAEIQPLVMNAALHSWLVSFLSEIYYPREGKKEGTIEEFVDYMLSLLPAFFTTLHSNDNTLINMCRLSQLLRLCNTNEQMNKHMHTFSMPSKQNQINAKNLPKWSLEKKKEKKNEKNINLKNQSLFPLPGTI